MKQVISFILIVFFSFSSIAGDANLSKTLDKKYNEMLPRWNLNDFYENFNSAKLKEDLAGIENTVNSFNKKYEKRVSNLTSEELYKTIVEYEKIAELMGKVSSYSYLLYSTNLQNKEILAFFQDTSEFMSNQSNKLLFFELELNSIPEKEMAILSQGNRYKPWLDKVRSFKPYQLSESEEKILNQKSISSSEYWVKLYDTTMATMRFPFQSQELPYAEIANKLFDKDEAVRKEAYLSVTSTLNQNIELLSLITNALAKDKEVDDTLRKAPSITTFRNLSNQVEDDVVSALVNSVKANYRNIAQKYYLLKAKWMHKEKIDVWDRNAPLFDSQEEYIPWDKAREIVLNSFAEFSPEFSELAKKFFDNNWIDAAVYDGKGAGAYAHPTVPSVHPYILINYQGKKSDVMTLAHELGHGVHQLLAKEVGYFLSHTPLILAETASIFGETLVFDYLLKTEKDPIERKAMLAKKVEDSLNTIFRQINFYEFEYKLHTARKQGELTSQQISAIWDEVTKEYIGDSIVFNSANSSLWSGVPHFIHSPFYVYSYAFGNCLVNSLYEVYRKKQVLDFTPKYLSLLSSGGSKKYNELLQNFDLNANDPAFWQKGLDVVGRMIVDLNNLN